MTDPITLQAELDAARQEIAHLRAIVDGYQRATTIPAPPLSVTPSEPVLGHPGETEGACGQ